MTTSTRTMHTCSLQHRISRVIPALSVAALLAMCWSSTSIAAATSPSKQSGLKLHTVRSSLTGKWSGQYSGAYSGTFKLRWTQSGSRLSGSITFSNARGTSSIKGTVRGSTIGFGAVGSGVTYSGSVSGNSMSGRYKTPKGGGSWRARRIS